MTPAQLERLMEFLQRLRLFKSRERLEALLQDATTRELSYADFLDSVRTRKPTIAPAEVAHLSCALVHLGTIAYRVGRPLRFDPQTETFPNNPEANRMLTKTYRSPFTL